MNKMYKLVSESLEDFIQLKDNELNENWYGGINC